MINSPFWRHSMSGIAGIFQFKDYFITYEKIQKFMEFYKQFPSDDHQMWIKGNIFLGCHAQWITPESVGEPLPYYDYERGLAITADAIIDNREDLFHILNIPHNEKKVIPDSQLILLAYSKWGEEVPKHLIGDFAFMIWDEKEQKMFGARDFSGSRTLYYYCDEQRFVFSTIIKPLFTLPFIGKKINEEWIAEFLAIPTMVEAVDMSTTPYQSVFQVPPSHSITVTSKGVVTSRYYVFENISKIKYRTNKEYEEAFREVFQKAVKARTRTFGKVGSHLSGGLDSGTVVSFAANELKKENKELYTYSYIPEENFKDWTPGYYIPDERPYIKETVNYIGNISDQYLSFDKKSPLTEMDDLIDIMEMPYKFFENSFWLKGISEKAGSQGIKVLLNGARGNHSISWGNLETIYYYYSILAKQLRWIDLNHQMNFYCKNFKTGKRRALPKIFKNVFHNGPFLHSYIWEDNPYLKLLNPTLAKKANVNEKIKEFQYKDRNPCQLRKNHFGSINSWNRNGLFGTKMSLRYSLWERDPTNDINVINFCLSLPLHQFVQDGFTRSLIRRATENKLPDIIRLNQRTRGMQGADTIHRLSRSWTEFVAELKDLSSDSKMIDIVDTVFLKNAISSIENSPKDSMIYDLNFKMLTRSLIVYRFLNRSG